MDSKSKLKTKKRLLVRGFAAVVEDVDDDGGADEGGDAVDGHGAFETGSTGNQVTD